jgi:hypothetical protein
MAGLMRGLSRIISTKKELWRIIMVVNSIEIPVDEPIDDVVVEWQRGKKTSVTDQAISLSPLSPVGLFSESFYKDSIFFKNKDNTY